MMVDKYLFDNFILPIEDEKLFSDTLISFCAKAENVVEKPGNDKVTFNYYPQEEKGLQLVIEGTRNGTNVAVGNIKVHHTSPTVWKLKIITSLKDFDDTYVVSDDNGGCMVVRLVNEQVLGDINEGDVIEVQVAGMAVAVDFFENDEAYENSVPTEDDGRKLLLEDGAVVPIEWIVHNNDNLSEEEKNNQDHSLDDLLDFKGTVIQCWKYSLKIHNTDLNSYYMAEIDTTHGKLNVVIPTPVMPKGLRGFGRGNVITGKLLLSGDACIYDKEQYLSKIK